MGGGGKGGSSVQTVSIPPEVLARYNAVNAKAEEVAKTPFKEYGNTEEAFVAPLTQTQQSGIANTNAAANQAQPYFGAATQQYNQNAGQAQQYNNAASSNITGGLAAATPFTYAGGQAVNAQQFSPQGVSQYMNPYMNAVIGGTLAPLQQQQAMDQQALTGKAIGAGAFGGNRADLAQAALRGQQQMATGNVVGGLLNQGYGQAQNMFNTQQAVNLAAGQANRQALQQTGQNLFNQYSGTGQALAGLGNQTFNQGVQGANTIANLGTGAQNAALQGAQAQLGAGQVQQQTNQAGKSALYNQFLQKQSYPFQTTQFLANIAEGTGALSGSTTSSNQSGGFFSDERLKEDIKPIGKTFDGQPIYKYNYKGDDRTQIGLMAQDVEKHHPEAVGLHSGYKTVDYDKATKGAEHRGHFSHGGSSMGGGVIPANDRHAYATYGAVGYGAGSFDPDYIKQILANQQGQYSQMYGQPGSPRGATGTPGAGAGRVPAATMPVAKLTVAPALQQRSGSGIANAAQTGRNLKDVFSMGKDAYGALKPKTAVEKIKELDAKEAEAAAQKELDTRTKAEADKNPDKKTSDSGVDKKVAESQSQDRGLGGNKAPVEVAELDRKLPEVEDEGMSGLFSDFAARGGVIGRKHFKDGGADDNVEGLYDPVQGLNIPDEKNKYKLNEEAAGNTGSGSKGGGGDGLGEALGVAKTVFDIGKFFLLKDGGVAGRDHHALRGATDSDKAVENGLVEEEAPKPTGLMVADVKPSGTKSDAAPSIDDIVDQNFTNVLRQESGNEHFDKKTGKAKESSKGAVGIAQVMPGTGPIAAKMAGLPWDEKKLYEDPEYNKSLGRAYYKAMLEKYKDPVLASAAYNAGPGRLDLALEAARESGKDVTNYLPAETRNYLRAIHGYNSAPLNEDDKARLKDIKTAGLVTTNKEGQAVAVPGTAGQGRGSTDPYNSPWLNIAKSVLPEKTPEALTSPNFVIPALAGIGTMLASDKRNLGQAIGEGLVGGTAAYQAQQMQGANIANTQAQTEKTYADIAGGSIHYGTDGIAYVRYKDPKTGQYQLMPSWEWLSLPADNRPQIDPRDEVTVRERASQDFDRSRGATAAPKPNAGAGAAGSKPAVTEEPKPAQTTETNPAVTAEPKPAPSTGAQVAAPAGIIKAPDELIKTAPQKAVQLLQKGNAIDQERDVYTPQDDVAKAVQAQKPQLVSLTNAVVGAPRQGVLAPSALQPILSPIVNYANGLAAAAGAPSLFNEETIANKQEFLKNVAQLKRQATTEAGQKAVSALEQIGQGLPSEVNSPQALAKIMADLYIVSQREIDKQNYFNQYRKAIENSGPAGQRVALRSGRDLEAAFNNQYNAAFYQGEKEALIKMYNQGPTDKNGQHIINQKTGQPMSWMEIATATGGKLTADQHRLYDKEFGPDILRYFGIGRK
jgi:hypothetical protein